MLEEYFYVSCNCVVIVLEFCYHFYDLLFVIGNELFVVFTCELILSYKFLKLLNNIIFLIRNTNKLIQRVSQPYFRELQQHKCINKFVMSLHAGFEVGGELGAEGGLVGFGGFEGTVEVVDQGFGVDAGYVAE